MQRVVPKSKCQNNNNDLFRITSWTDITMTKKNHGTIKTLVREAVNSDSPEATKEKGIPSTLESQ